MQAAQQVHRIGQVPRTMRARGFQEGIQVRMARATLTRDAGKLSFGNADRFTVYRAVDRHSHPFVRIRQSEALVGSS
jgi:hypothetical protein